MIWVNPLPIGPYPSAFSVITALASAVFVHGANGISKLFHARYRKTPKPNIPIFQGFCFAILELSPIGSGKGIAPSPSHRTVRETLTSHGSSCL